MRAATAVPLPMSGVLPVMTALLQISTWAWVAGTPIRQVIASILQALVGGSNSGGIATPAIWQRGSVWSLAITSGAAAANVSNIDDAPEVVIAMFSRMRLA